jgi:hypothetical protein
MVAVRPTAAADLAGLSALYEAGFGRPLSPAEWEWKYRRLPGEGRSVVAVDDTGAVVAHAGAYAVPARWPGGEALAWQLADFVGTPRGLRPPLVRAGRALLAELPRPEDLPAIFGFPSDRHLALGERVFGYHWLPPVVPWEGELTRAEAADATAPLEVGDRAGEWAEPVWAACAVSGVVRSAAFLNWRYYARPERYYRVYRLHAGGHEGLVVAAFVARAAWLAELWLPPGPDWLPALRGVAADLQRAGLERWRAWLPSGDPAWAAALLTALGMSPTAERVPCGCRGAAARQGDGDGREVVALARSLYYAMGDHDLV